MLVKEDCAIGALALGEASYHGIPNVSGRIWDLIEQVDGFAKMGR